jgi:4-oxalomesaconate hydratase
MLLGARHCPRGGPANDSNEYRDVQPEFVLTHYFADPYNPDHPMANRITLDTRVYAQALGYPAKGRVLGAPPVFLFEPHQPEQCD